LTLPFSYLKLLPSKRKFLSIVADFYDALVTRRVYKSPFPHKESVDIIKNGYANHFDPDIVNAFIEIEKELNEIAKKF